MNADTELDALVGRQAGVALDHAALGFDRAAYRVHHAAKLDDAAVPGTPDDPAVVERNGRVKEVAAERPEARERAFLVGSHKPRVADDVGDQDRRQFPGL